MKNKVGFTLVELLIVIALIGILASIAVPVYKKQITRARQNEAKGRLTQLFLAEKSYFSDAATYTACLAEIGVKVPSEKKFYSFGFSTDVATASVCGPVTANKSCLAYFYDQEGNVSNSCSDADGSTYFTANSVMESGDSTVHINSGNIADVLQRATFTAKAVGKVSDQGVIDKWYIDHNQKMINDASGWD